MTTVLLGITFVMVLPNVPFHGFFCFYYTLIAYQLDLNVNYLQMAFPYFRLFTMLISPKVIGAVTSKRYLSGHTNRSDSGNCLENFACVIKYLMNNNNLFYLIKFYRNSQPVMLP